MKIIISLGGYGNSDHFGPATSPKYIDPFVASLIKFVTFFQFDGIDIDWEFPNANEASGYLSLLQKLQEGFKGSKTVKGEDYEISADFMPHQHHLGVIDIKAVCEALTYGNVMSYDLHTTKDVITGHHTPIINLTPSNVTGEHTTSMDIATTILLRGGCPASKLNVGLTGYSRSVRESIHVFLKTFNLQKPETINIR
jgi:chitinase